jgi:7-cyano-7-deazaguanine synthase in queuosine biosynthesis
MVSDHYSMRGVTSGRVGNTCVLISGGVDSFIGWVRMGYPEALYVVINHKYKQLELEALDKLSLAVPDFRNRLTMSHEIAKIGEWEKPDAEIPARNLLLAIVAAQKGFSTIGLVCQQDERSIPDRSIMFFEQTNSLLSSLFNRNIELTAVFPQSDKTDMIEWYLQAGETEYSRDQKVDWLKKTVACYTPVYKRNAELLQCGKCPACFRRAVAFSLNGIEEKYDSDVWTSDVAKEYQHRALNSYYSAKRCGRILSAFHNQKLIEPVGGREIRGLKHGKF